jgi:broad specificity phosphatase PhoE
MALVIFVRHGQTDDNVSGRISGQGPVPLNTRGQEQARLDGEVLAPLGVRRLLSSPVRRAWQTAEMIGSRLQLEIEPVPELREVGYGDWEGKRFSDIRSEPTAHQVMHNPIQAVFPQGESLLGVQQRGVRTIESIRRTCPADAVIAMVSHGDTIRTTLAYYLGMTFNDYRRIVVDNGAISVIELVEQGSQVKAINFVPQADNLCLEAFYDTWQKTQTLVNAQPVSSGTA